MHERQHLKGLPALGEFVLPDVGARDLAAIFIGAIDAAKERQMKEVLRIVDELRGRDGCVAVDVLKRVLTEKIR